MARAQGRLRWHEGAVRGPIRRHGQETHSFGIRGLCPEHRNGNREAQQRPAQAVMHAQRRLRTLTIGLHSNPGTSPCLRCKAGGQSCCQGGSEKEEAQSLPESSRSVPTSSGIARPQVLAGPPGRSARAAPFCLLHQFPKATAGRRLVVAAGSSQAQFCATLLVGLSTLLSWLTASPQPACVHFHPHTQQVLL
jgi:hypothetical protein